MQPVTGEGSGAAVMWRTAWELGDGEGLQHEHSRPNSRFRNYDICVPRLGQ